MNYPAAVWVCYQRESFRVFDFRIVEVIAGWKFFVTFEMLGAQGIGNTIFFPEPFAEINELATFGTERAIRFLEPWPFFFASRTSNRALGAHENILAQP